MEFNINREVFLEGIQKTLSIVERRTTMPILNNILIRTEDKGICLIATNREIGLISQYDAHVVASGEITLSARKLFEMIREIEGEIVHLKMNESSWVSISCGKIHYRIPGISADDYPKVDEGDQLPFVKFQSEVLSEMISKTFFAMSQEEMRINLNGIFMEVEEQEGNITVRMIATDGHRLSLVKRDLGNQHFLRLDKGIIIPRRGVSEIKKMTDSIQEVQMGVNKGMLILKTQNTILKISLIDADYPDYRRVVAMEEGNIVTLHRDQFLHALKRMGVMASDKYNGVRIKISQGLMSLNSTNPDIGEANEEVEAMGVEKALEAVYNVRYLIDAVEVMDEENIIFEMREGLKPGTIRPAHKDNYLCIVMPLKL
jgi:DNA polymerase-3 subunit beta